MTHSHRLDKKLGLVSQTTDERLAIFLSTYGKQLLIAGAITLLMLLGAYMWHKIGQGHAEADYLKAEKAYQELLQDQDPPKPLKDNPAFEALQTILTRHPELTSRYGGAIAQIALQQGEIKLAVQYADHALKQLINENLPFYEEFSKTSLLIAEGHDREAYKRAAFLQKRMREEMQNADAEFRQSLLLFNQIRIASLMQRLGMRGDERKSWQEVQQLASSTNSRLLEGLKTGQVSFKDYVQSRIDYPEKS